MWNFLGIGPVQCFWFLAIAVEKGMVCNQPFAFTVVSLQVNNNYVKM